MKIFLLTLISIFHLALSQNECLPATCGHYAPFVRFPFWIKGQQPEHCGYPGFGLSCNESRADLDLLFPVTAASATNVMLPLNMTVAVWDIDYKAQKMLVDYARPHSCLPEKLPTVNSSASPIFEAEAIGYGEGSTLFNCSNTGNYEAVACLSSRSYKVIEFGSVYDITSLPPYSSCFKMYSISYVPDRALTGGNDEYGSHFYLKWSRPSCGKCEAQGDYCRLQNSSAAEETECFTPQCDITGNEIDTGASTNHKPLAAAGVTLLAFTVIASFFIFKVVTRRRKDNERIENAVKNHKDMRPRRYSYADVKRLTNHFKEKLSHEALHKGKLADGTPVAVKVLDASQQDDEDFIAEVEIIGGMQHANILQIIGYCIDGGTRALIYEFLQGGTLADMVLSPENQNQTVGWEKQHQIALDIAKGVEYVHQESAQKFLNLVWNPQSILLDHNFNPKIIVSTTSADGRTSQYTAPELFSSSSNVIPQKAYAYGFGMLLLDMVGTRVSTYSRGDDISDVRFPEWLFREVEEREEGKLNESVKKLLIVAVWCIQWFPSDRPSMKAVIEMLQQQTMPANAMPQYPFHLNTQN
ncbi:rust resistance kinase Lr10-like isoform X2 [Salvia splendens]|uniref:rust resistance kinase Lr10-like isoform X2 n=1 Tax=Salvia splendens TaxID=180675 RepID=UPI001C277B17|nr:rust resistance kinase Lr10-like isoform X2 [Salvia splendens]